MVTASVAYQILREEKPTAIGAVRAILEQHPWYAERWREHLEKIPEAERDEFLFMLAARWPDDIRTRDRAQHRGPWHYTNFPFKPAGQPDSVTTKPPEPVNILTALALNEKLANTEADAGRRAVALAWLFHLVGDVHQPLHTAQVFTTEFPNGDRGGNEICVRSPSGRKPMDLHRFWDSVITTSSNTSRLRNEAMALRNRPEFSRSQLTELSSTWFEAWGKESFEIAVKIAYRNGAIPGKPKGSAKECDTVTDAGVLPAGYARAAGHIAERRTMLAGLRLADLLKRF